jgi:NitT/TauT family transport system substrate-binding protein
MKKNRIITGIVVVIALIIILVISHPNKEPNKIILAESSLAVPSSLTFIAREKGFWKEENLDIQVASFASGRLAFDAVLAGKADIATVAETPLVLAGFRKQDFRIISTIMESDKEMKVIARKDAGIANPSDLKGKKVATFLGSNAEYFMESFLSANGISRSEVKIINLQPPDMVIALAKKDIDAAFIWQPHISNAQNQLGEQAIIFPNNGIYKEAFNIVSTKEFAQKNQKVLKSVIKGLLKAEKFVQENREESIRIVARQVNIAPDELSKFWNEYEFKVGLSDSLIDLMNIEGEWAIKAKIAPEGSTLPDYASYILVEPLRALNPERVMFKVL